MDSKTISKTFTRQHDQSDCGIACLISIIKFYNGDIRPEQLKQWSGTTKQGTTLLGLYQAARKAGLKANGCQGDIASLKQQTTPVILHLSLENKLDHYVICYGITNDIATIGDPGRGIIKMDCDQLNALWHSKTCLITDVSTDFIPSSDRKKKKRQWFLNIIENDVQVLFASVILGLLTATLGLTLAIFNQKLIDDILPSHNHPKLVAAIILLGLLLLIKGGLKTVRQKILLMQGRKFNVKIATRFFSTLLKLPKTFFDSKKSGDLIARLNDTSRIQQFITQTIGNLSIEFIVLTVSLFAIFIYNAYAGMISLFIVPVYGFIMIKMNRTIKSRQLQVLEHYAHSESFYLNTLQSIEPIKDFAKTDLFGAKNKNIYQNFQHKVFQLGNISIKLSLISEIIGAIYIGSIAGLGIFQVVNDEMKTGALLAIITIASSIVPTITSLLLKQLNFQEALLAFDRMYEFIDIPSSDNSQKMTSANILPLEIKNVSFRFPGHSTLLKNIDLAIHKNKITALLGESGCGKSTMTHLIKGDYEIEKGEILFNNTPVANIDTDELRQRISIVPQTINLFNDTILFNILLEEISKENTVKTIEELNRIGLLSYFDQFPQGLLTKVGEDGINLSGGQKQVLAVARALINRPQLLILDEATSAMDQQTEAYIFSLLKKLNNNIAILFITHRIHILHEFSDEIYILKNKTVEISGTPEELMESSNYYSDFWNQLSTPKTLPI